MFCLPFPAEPFSLKFVLHKDALFYWINLGNLKSVPLSFFIISKSASSFFKKQLSSEKFNPWKDETKESCKILNLEKLQRPVFNKRSCLAIYLGVKGLMTVIAMVLVTVLFCLGPTQVFNKPTTA